MPRQFHRLGLGWKILWRHRILKKGPTMDIRRAGLVYVKRNGLAIPADQTVQLRCTPRPSAKLDWRTAELGDAGLRDLKLSNFNMRD